VKDDGEDYNEPRIVYCPTHAQAPALRAALTAALDHIEAFYGRPIEDAYRRGDATKEEWIAVLKARVVLQAIDEGNKAS
jgi:hypothetical protein